MVVCHLTVEFRCEAHKFLTSIGKMPPNYVLLTKKYVAGSTRFMLVLNFTPITYTNLRVGFRSVQRNTLALKTCLESY